MAYYKFSDKDLKHFSGIFSDEELAKLSRIPKTDAEKLERYRLIAKSLDSTASYEDYLELFQIYKDAGELEENDRLYNLQLEQSKKETEKKFTRLKAEANQRRIEKEKQRKEEIRREKIGADNLEFKKLEQLRKREEKWLQQEIQRGRSNDGRSFGLELQQVHKETIDSKRLGTIFISALMLILAGILITTINEIVAINQRGVSVSVSQGDGKPAGRSSMQVWMDKEAKLCEKVARLKNNIYLEENLHGDAKASTILFYQEAKDELKEHRQNKPWW